MTNLERARTLVANVLRIPADRIEPGTSLSDVAQLDSLSLVEIASALDEEFDIRVPSDTLATARTLENIVTIIEGCPPR